MLKEQQCKRLWHGGAKTERRTQTSALYKELPPSFKAWHRTRRELQTVSNKIGHWTLDSVHQIRHWTLYSVHSNWQLGKPAIRASKLTFRNKPLLTVKPKSPQTKDFLSLRSTTHVLGQQPVAGRAALACGEVQLRDGPAVVVLLCRQRRARHLDVLEGGGRLLLQPGLHSLLWRTDIEDCYKSVSKRRPEYGFHKYATSPSA